MTMEALISSILSNNVELLKDLLSNEVQTIFSGDCKVKIDNELAKITTIYLHEESDEIPNLDFYNQQSEFVGILLNQGANNGNNDKEFCQIGLDFFNFICKFATANVVQFLIKHGRFLYCKDKWDLIRILHALSCGKEELYKMLLNNGLGAVEIDRLHLLHYGVQSRVKSEEIIEKFLQVGADLNGLDHEKCTILDLAMEAESLKIIKILIGKQAKMNRRKIDDEYGCKVFHYAVVSENVEIVSYFLKYGDHCQLQVKEAIFHAIKTDNEVVVKLFLEHVVEFNETHKKESVLAFAVTNGKEKIVELMLEQGVVPKNATIFEAIESEHLNIVKLLLSVRLGANCSTDEESPIFKAISNNNLKAVKLLLNNGADVNVKDVHGFTALMIATSPHRSALYYGGLFVQMQNAEILVQLLLDFRADINVMRGNGETALTYLIACRMNSMWKILVKQMALMKSQGSFINDANLTAVKESEQASLFYAKCLSELDLLTSVKFDDSDLSYFDIYKIKDVRRLAHLARNPSIFDGIKSDGFIDEFPNYGEAIVENFNRGVSRDKDFELVKRFVNYLSDRDHDQLSKIPITVASKLFTFLNDDDVATLWEL